MRFHVMYNDLRIFIGFQPKGFRFVFYTHGKIFKVADWRKFIESFDLKIYDEDGNWLTWDEFMGYVDHLQRNSNAKWVNGYFVDHNWARQSRRWDDGYNFSNNSKHGRL